MIPTHPVQYIAPQLCWLSTRVSLEVLYLCRQNVIDNTAASERFVKLRVEIFPVGQHHERKVSA